MVSEPCLIPTGDFKAGEVVGDRYQMMEILGQGSSGMTYKVCSFPLNHSMHISSLEPSSGALACSIAAITRSRAVDRQMV